MRERLDEAFDGNDEWEQTLSQLQPLGSSVSRDRLMFLAGRQAALREKHSTRRWTWPLATAASWLVTAAVAGLWLQSVSHPQQIPVARNEQPKGEEITRHESEPSVYGGNEVAEPIPAVANETEQSAVRDVASINTRPRPPLSSLRSPPSHGRNHPRTIESLLDGTDQPRLSMVGWRSWDRSRETLADRSPPTDVDASITVPPATYSRLMKLYLDEQAVPEIRGGLL